MDWYYYNLSHLSMSSFLSDYAIVTNGNEIPKIFHTWAGFSCLSHLVGPRVWTTQGFYKVYANMYVVLVGSPGVKKTQALRFAQRIVTKAAHVAQAPSSITKEAIIKLMGEKDSRCKGVYKYLDHAINFSQLAIFASEFINLLNAGGNPIGMIDFFTEVWDSVDTGYQDTTKNKGDYAIERPYISILACMTDATIKNLIAQKVVSAGMTRRCLFVTGKSSEVSVPFPEVTQAQIDALHRCVGHAHTLNQLCGEFQWTPEARREYEVWYHSNTMRRNKEPNEILQQFLQTKPELVIKLAMIHQLADHDPALVINAESVTTAIKEITAVEMGGPALFEGTGRNPLSAVASEIERHIVQSPQPITQKSIYLRFHKDATTQEIDMLLETLRRMDKIKGYGRDVKGVRINYYTSFELYARLPESER